MGEQKIVQFDGLQGVTIRLTHGDEQFGPNWINFECLDQNFNVIPGHSGGFRGPGNQPPPDPLPVETPETPVESEETPPEEVPYA